MKKLIAVATMLSLSACVGGPSSTNSVKTAEQRSGFLGLGEKDSMSVNTGAAFKGVNEVIIGGFTVGFDQTKRESVKAGGGLLGSGFGGRSSAVSKLSGIDNATMQKITDDSYKLFVASLEKKGYKVIDRSELLSSESFKGTKDYPVPYEDTQGGGIMTEGNLTKYFAPSSFGGKLKVFMGDIMGTTGGFAFDNPTVAASEFAEKSGRKVIHVSFKVDFANSDSYGGWHTNSSAIEVGQGITIVPEFSKVGIIGGQSGTFSDKVGNITLGQPISSDVAFAEIVNSNSDAYKTAEVAANIIGTLGGVGSNSSREYEFKANPAKYADGAKDALAKASDAFISQMQSLK